MIANFDEQKAIAHLEEQRISFLAFLVDIPIFDRLVVHAQEGLRGGLPRDGFIASESRGGEWR
jgi:hypothetical protein